MSHIPSPRPRVAVTALLCTAALLVVTSLSQGVLAQGTAKTDKGKTSPAKELKVGLIDLAEVFNKYARKEALETSINAEKDKFAEEVKKQNKLLRALDEEAQDLTGGKLWQMQDRIKLELQRREIQKERFQRLIRQKLVDMTLLLLEDINDVIKKYGKEFGYTFILKVDNQGFGREEFREKIFRAQVQSVLYYDAGIDITAPITQRLNARFKAGDFNKTTKGGKGK